MGGGFNSSVYVTGFGFIDPSTRFAVSFRVSTPSRRILQPGAYTGRVCVILCSFDICWSADDKWHRSNFGWIVIRDSSIRSVEVTLIKILQGFLTRSGTIPETTE